MESRDSPIICGHTEKESIVLDAQVYSEKFQVSSEVSFLSSEVSVRVPNILRDGPGLLQSICPFGMLRAGAGCSRSVVVKLSKSGEGR